MDEKINKKGKALKDRANRAGELPSSVLAVSGRFAPGQSEWDDLDCCQTKEQAKQELENIEKKLAVRYHLEFGKDNVREYLFALDRANELIEDELVASWHQAYAWYVNYP